MRGAGSGLARSAPFRWQALLMACLAGLLCTWAATVRAFGDDRAGPANEASLLAAGQRIYREGLLPSGQALQGLGAAGVRLTGAQAACTTCHRRSGHGSSEGPIEVRPITGPALFGTALALPRPDPAAHAGRSATAASSPSAEQARARATALREARRAAMVGTRQRPVYDEASLAQAIGKGIDVTGRAMDASMPRYALDPEAMAALAAYLRTLSVQASPGVTEDQLHFATVIQPGTDPARRKALLDVLQTFLQDRNRGLRTEQRREDAGMVRLNRNYREWVLHTWDLSGPPHTWAGQLEAFNRQQPVFALISGLGEASWQPIHDFSERNALPCILPQTVAPALAERDFYTVYLSKGVTLEAQLLASFLHARGEHGPIIQVFRREDAGALAAAGFRQAWAAAGGSVLRDQIIEASPDAAFWRQLASQSPATSLVLWLAPPDLAQAQALLAPGSKLQHLYLSSDLAPDGQTSLDATGDERVRRLYTQDLPNQRSERTDEVRRWLRGRGLELVDEALQMNAYLAVSTATMAVSHSQDVFSREFMLERVEHRLGTAHEPSIYPRLSLGPGQRYASKGGYVVQRTGAQMADLKPLSGWIVP